MHPVTNIDEKIGTTVGRRLLGNPLLVGPEARDAEGGLFSALSQRRLSVRNFRGGWRVDDESHDDGAPEGLVSRGQSQRHQL